MPDCPARETLEQFLAGALDDHEQDDLCAHVEVCSACQRELNDLVESPSPKPGTPEGPSAEVQELDLSFLKHLQQTLTDPDWRPPPWTESGPHLGRFTEGDGQRSCMPPGSVPDYELLGELGRGSMGVVYKARQLSLGRLTALKMILAGEHASLNDRTRFRAEAEAAASLRHANIVQVHETGEAGGLLYFSMEYVEGETLKQWLHGEPKPARAVGLLMEALARAVAFAHSRGIVHRDLKPANVLLEAVEVRTTVTRSGGSVDPAAELARLGRVPKIADFGLAKRLGDALGTQTGQLMGTPSYMSPEQLAGRAGATGPGVDIYALGCILYEALTGRPPFLDASLEALADRVRREEPVPPRRLQPGCSRDLETICLKCLEKEPARRYATAGELAEDLRRFLAHEPIAARAPSSWDRLIKLVRRNKATAAGIAGIIASVLLGIAATSYLAWREGRARQQADANAEVARGAMRRAQAAETITRREAYLARLSAAEAALREHDVSRAVQQLDLAPGGLRGWEWAHFRARLDDGLGPISGGGRWTDLIGFLDDGRLAVFGTGTIELRTSPFTEPSSRIPARAARVLGVWDASTPDQTRFLVREQGNRLRLVDQAGATLRLIQLELGFESLVCAVRPDRRSVAVWSNSRSVPQSKIRRIYDLETGSSLASLGESGYEVYDLKFDSSGLLMAAACGDGAVRIWDAATGRPTAVIKGHAGDVRAVAIRPDGHRVASGGADRTVRIWDPASGRLLETSRSHQTPIVSLAYSSDGRRIVSAEEDGPIRLWEPGRDESHGRSLHGHPQGISRLPFIPDLARRLAFSPDGALLASLGTTGDVRLWDVSDAGDPRVLRGHTAEVYPVAYSPDGGLIASGGWDQKVRVWDATSGEPTAVLEHELCEDPDFVLSVVFSPDGTRLASWARYGQIRVWDAATGRLLLDLNHAARKRSGFVHELTFSPDGTRLYAGKEDRVVCWDTRTGRELTSLPLPLREIRIVAFRPDGRRLAAAGRDDELVVVDPVDGRVVVRLRHEGSPIEAARFSPDGRCLATGGDSGAVRLWDADTGRLLRSLESHAGEVFAVAWHPDGTRLASAGRDRIIRIWDPESGDELIGLAGHSSYVFSLAFSPDGQTLASGSGDSTVRLWDTFPVARRLQARRASKDTEQQNPH
jgi:eukaryotic-like serine/threonine-protein kinase